jgi:ABC-type lipoprotein export system ATPase subunit
MTMAETRIELKNVSKYYRTPRGVVSALHDLSLRVAEGEFIAVQGPSGCGKSTLLLTIGGLLAPDEGRVEVAGINPYALAPDARARFRAGAIGFVFQQFHLVPYLTVRDNILAPAGALSRNGAPERAETLIRRFNLTHRAGHRPAELSTGERQRTALARALLNEPRLLLADEPTGNLDRDNAAVVMEAFMEFAKSGGTVLLVTHDDKIAGTADRTIKLRQTI